MKLYGIGRALVDFFPQWENPSERQTFENILLQLYSVGNEYFNYILLGITLGMIVYYLLKCLCIYVRYKTKGK